VTKGDMNGLSENSVMPFTRKQINPCPTYPTL